ncbi:MAG: hypothetical protein AAF799_09740 [Myxococcota bacterium]
MIGWGRRWMMGAVAAVALGAWPNTSMAGKLDSVRSEVSGSSSSSSSSGSSGSSDSSSSSSCCDWSSDDDGYSFGGGGGGGVAFGASGGGWAELEYRQYPYAHGARTYLSEPIDEDEADELEEPTRPRSGMVWAEGAVQGKDLWRGAGGLRYDGRRISLDGDLSYYVELPADDALYLGTANLSLIPVKTKRAILRLGGGVNTMIDGRVPGEGPREYALGWNVTGSLDLFPAWPIVLSGRVDAGRLYKAWVGRGRATLGVMVSRLEIFGGYEHMQVGKVGLGGPTFGLRVWL